MQLEKYAIQVVSGAALPFFKAQVQIRHPWMRHSFIFLPPFVPLLEVDRRGNHLLGRPQTE